MPWIDRKGPSTNQPPPRKLPPGAVILPHPAPKPGTHAVDHVPNRPALTATEPTARQIANRANAAKSTGPKTEAGKAASSRNSVKHGLYASVPLIALESTDEFEAFRERMLDRLKPTDEVQSVLAGRIISAAWRLGRAVNVEGALLDRTIGDGDLSHSLSFDSLRQFNHLTRYEAALERSLYRALDALASLQTSREEKSEKSGNEANFRFKPV